MATPHVAGFVAYLLGMDPSLSVEVIEATIDCYATRNAITLSAPGQYSPRRYFTESNSLLSVAALDADTPNKLLYNNNYK